MSIIVCLSGVMLIYKINDSEGKVVGVGESSYEESGAFEQRMGDASRNVLERIRVKEQLEADGKYDPNRLVDVIAYDKDGKKKKKKSRKKEKIKNFDAGKYYITRWDGSK